MNCNNPSIDVIVPLFNDSKNIRFAIDSLLGQTQPISAIIIVDDGSTDGSAEMVEKLYSSDSKIKLVRSQHRGISGARNAGLKFANSEFIGFLDSDDIWDRDKLRLQIQAFQNRPNLGAIYCKYSIIDNSGALRPERWVMDPKLEGNIFNSLLAGNQISGSASAVLVRKKYLDLVGDFDESLRFCEDWDMWIRLSRVCTFSFVDRDLVHIRQNDLRSRENLRVRWDKYDAHLSMWSKWPKEVSTNSEVLKLIRDRCYYHYCVSGRISLGRSLKCAFLMDRRFKDKMHPKIYKASIGSIGIILFKISILKLDETLYETKNLLRIKLSIAKTFILELPGLILGKIASRYKWAGPLKRRLISKFRSNFWNK